MNTSKSYKINYLGKNYIPTIFTSDENNPNKTIAFYYKSNQNEVPYISTYYIKPIVSPDEEVIIDYYITDYYHKEYVNEDYSEIFTVTVRIEGKDDIIIKNLQAGDHSVSLGTFPNLDGQEQKFSILCTDKCGRNSHELFNFFLVKNEVPVNEYIMTEEDLTTYGISNTNDTTMITSTREGLQKLLDDKQAAGYNRLKLLEGTYRIDHLGTIYIPTMFTLDMNSATLKLHEFAGDKALMMELNNTFDSHVINGTIEGDYYNHDYDNSSNNSEWVMGVSIGGECKYSSFENLAIKDITGYGAGNGISISRDGKLGYTYSVPVKGAIGDTFKLGDIDRTTGLDIESTNRTTCDFMDISGYSDIGYLSVSVYLGYQGNSCGTWNLICHFYDENKNFIKSIDAYQYRRVGVPSNSKFMRVTILNEAYPTNLSIQLFRVPTHCSFKNIKFDNCRCVGLAQAAMKDMLVESCEFTNSGQTAANCAYDAEDGWDMMQDVTFRRLNFHDNPMNEFLTCAGHNFVVEDMVQGDVYIWDRTNSFVYRNNVSSRGAVRLQMGTRQRGGYYRVYNNEINSCMSVSDAGGKANNWQMIIRDNKINGRASNDIGAGKYINCEIGKAINATAGSTWDVALGEGEFENCYIHDKSGDNQGGIYRNCKFENIKGYVHRIFDIQDSEIKNFNCILGNNDPEFILKNSKATNFSIQFGHWHQGGVMNIENCEIDNEDYLFRLPHYAMKKPITIKNNSFTTKGANGMVWYYDDRTGGSAGDLVSQDNLKFESNTIDIPNSLYIITGLTQTTVNNINIIAIKNIYTPSTLLLCNPNARLCPNIIVTEN